MVTVSWFMRWKAIFFDKIVAYIGGHVTLESYVCMTPA